QKKMEVKKSVRFREDVNVDKGSTSQMTDTKDTSDINELALALAKHAIDAAVKSVEEAEHPVKNINWITHGEFTAERGCKQIEEFVSVS
uniref:Uncharacterized protein n=1 Tax=Sus scrofa TaxID=9823 RepID=A0A8D0NHD8_PIG